MGLQLCTHRSLWKKLYPCLFLISLYEDKTFPKRSLCQKCIRLLDILGSAFDKGSARSFQAWIPMTSTTSYLVQVRALLGITGGSNSIQKCEVWVLFYMQVRDIPQEYVTFWRNFFVHGRYLILFHTYRYYTRSRLCEAKDMCTDSRCHTCPCIFVPYWSFVEPGPYDLAVRVCCLEPSGFLASSPPRRIACNLLMLKNGQSFVWIDSCDGYWHETDS